MPRARVLLRATVLAMLCGSAMAALAQEATQALHAPGILAVPAQIAVDGQATVQTLPDRIRVALGVETVDGDLAQSKRQNAAIVVAAMTALKQMGIAEDAIAIDGASVMPRYRDPARRQGLVTYVTRNAFTVTVAQASQVEPVVAAALQAGVNYVHAVEYGSSALAEHQDAAREQALLAAREKAARMAATLGQKLGAPLRIEEGAVHWQFHGGERYAWGAAPEAAAADDSPDLLGKITVHAKVRVVFALQD
ncbi:SIMPL domain-containing protein [Lampropedia cohaerens]|nr:SIMPL domain-containing protein [Lampropedia cohaerens]